MIIRKYITFRTNHRELIISMKHARFRQADSLNRIQNDEARPLHELRLGRRECVLYNLNLEPGMKAREGNDIICVRAEL